TIAGTLTSPADSNLVAKVGGKVLANNAIAMTLGNSSGHAGGPIAGTGSGTFTVSGTKITMSINFNFTSPFLATGKLTLSGTQAVQTSIVVTPPATQTATAGKSKSFALGSFTQKNATAPFTIDVNWGDGSAHTKFTQSAAGTITPKAHTFTKAVTDAVSVTITD